MRTFILWVVAVIFFTAVFVVSYVLHTNQDREAVLASLCIAGAFTFVALGMIKAFRIIYEKKKLAASVDTYEGSQAKQPDQNNL